MTRPSATNSRFDRILTFLRMLDDETVDVVLRTLNPSDARSLRQRLATHPVPDVRRQRKIMEEIEGLFHYAVKHTPTNVRLYEPEEVESFEATGDAIRDLESMNVNQVTSALEEESPRTVAILMKELSAERTAEVLGLMSPQQRNEVIRELSNDPTAPQIVLQQIASSISQRARLLPGKRAEEPDPVQRIANVLKVTDRKQRREIVKMLAEHDRETMAAINRQLYQIEDFLEMSDHQVRTVLEKVNTTTISTALHDVDEAVLERIMSNLSKRARETLQEELEFRSHQSGSEVQAARDEAPSRAPR